MRSRFLQYFSVATLVYVVGVIAWGVFIHSTNTRAPELQTLFELAHRLSSGICIGWVGVLLYLVRKETHPSHTIRRSTLWAFIFLIIDTLIGPGILLYEWIRNDVFSRDISNMLHLGSSFLLITALVITVIRAREIR